MKKILLITLLLSLSQLNYAYANELSYAPEEIEHYYPGNVFSNDTIEELINACPTLKQNYRNKGKKYIEGGVSIYGVILGMCRSDRTTCYRDVITKASEIYRSLGYKDVADKLLNDIYPVCAEKKIGTKAHNSCYMKLLNTEAKKPPMIVKLKDK